MSVEKSDEKETSDWKRVDALNDEDIDRAIADDPDAAPVATEEEMKNAKVTPPRIRPTRD